MRTWRLPRETCRLTSASITASKPPSTSTYGSVGRLGSRLAAAVLDTLLIWLAVLVLVLVNASFLSGASEASSWGTAILILLGFLLFWGYFTLFEALNGGRTPGKQALGIRVVMDTGRPVTGSAAVVRNLVRMLDCYFPLLPALPALIMMFMQRSNKRLGDMAAGTIVVRDNPTGWSLGVPTREVEEEPIDAGPPELSEEEFRLLDRFLGRLHELVPSVRDRIEMDLARRFETRIPRRTKDVEGYLVEVFTAEQRKRRSRFAVRAQRGAAGRTP